jgi:protein-tyrosine-phosphatase
MHIHFVCRGNVYRSRLAEAYLRSKQLPSVAVSSSGIEVAHDNSPISWVSFRILQRNKLIPFMSPKPIQTTLERLYRADLVIFMEEAHVTYVREHFGYTSQVFQVWNISDIILGDLDATCDQDTAIIRASEVTYRKITDKVDELIPLISERAERKQVVDKSWRW